MNEESHLLGALAFVRKRWMTMLAVFVGFVAAAAVWTVRQPPVYQATVRLVIGSGLASALIGDRATAVEGYFLERRSFDTQLEIMKSEPVAERAARLLGRLPEDASPARREAVVAGIAGAVNVVRVGDTRIVRLLAHDARPEGARDLANAMAEAFIAYSHEEHDEARRESVAWLTEETAHLREELRASEERLVEYLSREQIDPSERGDLAAAGPSGSLEAEIAAAEVDLSQLRQRYRDQHPVVLAASSRLASLRARARTDQVSRASESRKLIQYRILRRDADLDHEMYQLLLKKLKEADLSAGVGEPGVSVLEAAKLPNAPIAPHPVRNLGVAVVLGLCLALGLAYGVESLDATLGSADDVSRATGLPTLAVVSRFDAGSEDGLPSAVAPGSLASETFRALRTNVRFSHVDRPRRVVLVTSTGPEEGKSTILSNLAVSFAQSGRRTLLVDTDLRRPTLHRTFRAPNGRGLADLLAGDAELAETVHASAIDGLDVLPSGTLPPNPAELIESTALQQVLVRLRDAYDYVLLDSPPAGGLIDASLLCGLADGVLFVVESGRYDVKQVRATLRQLERAGSKLYGVVLNKAPRDGRAGLYGYGYYGYGRDLEVPGASSVG